MIACSVCGCQVIYNAKDQPLHTQGCGLVHDHAPVPVVVQELD